MPRCSFNLFLTVPCAPQAWNVSAAATCPALRRLAQSYLARAVASFMRIVCRRGCYGEARARYMTRAGSLDQRSGPSCPRGRPVSMAPESSATGCGPRLNRRTHMRTPSARTILLSMPCIASVSWGLRTLSATCGNDVSRPLIANEKHMRCATLPLLISRLFSTLLPIRNVRQALLDKPCLTSLASVAAR